MLYDMLSRVLQICMRGSDSDAALAWFARMVYARAWIRRIVVRRVIVHASEDVGLANPMAMLQAVAAAQALEADRHARKRGCPFRRRSSPCAKAPNPIPW